MPLTSTQIVIAKLLSKNRDEGSHLAGGSAMHFEPQSFRYSEDLDYFHDSLERVGIAYELDRKTLQKNSYKVQNEILTPGYIRALVSGPDGTCKIEWARDSSWRFMPVQSHPELGFVLHPIDLMINKFLALVGRDEARDFLDVLEMHQHQLSLGAQCWAACGKDPGFSPQSLIELLKRKGKYREEDFKRLHLVKHFKIDLHEIKKRWLEALHEAEQFTLKAPQDQVGCLYYSKLTKTFVTPNLKKLTKDDVVPHFGRAGGVLPAILEG
jgi:hypothetical protein